MASPIKPYVRTTTGDKGECLASISLFNTNSEAVPVEVRIGADVIYVGAVPAMQNDRPGSISVWNPVGMEWWYLPTAWFYVPEGEQITVNGEPVVTLHQSEF